MKSEYKIPFSKDIKFEIAEPTGDYAHENYSEIYDAIDFVVPVGTPVLAIKEGKIILSNDNSNEWGLD